MTKEKTFNIRVSAEMQEQLNKIADKRKLPISQLIRESMLLQILVNSEKQEITKLKRLKDNILTNGRGFNDLLDLIKKYEQIKPIIDSTVELKQRVLTLIKLFEVE